MLGRFRRFALCALLTLLGVGSCSGNKADKKGELIVSFQTDMSVPDDVDEIRVQVLLQGVVRHDVSYQVGPAPEKNPLPATLAVVAGSDPSIPVTIRVVALRNGAPYVLRQAITTVPTDRIALLHMPLAWLCYDNDVQQVGLDSFSDKCADETCIAGDCQDPKIDSKTLPTYSAESVFGGAAGPGKPGQCVDVLGCFDQGFESVVTTNPCRVPLPAGADLQKLNVGLVLPKGSHGICGPQACIVPLENDPLLGWEVSGNEIALPQNVCDKIGVDIDAVAVTTACVTKTPGIPICAPWSSVYGDFSDDAGPPDTDAGTDASDDASSEDAGEDTSVDDASDGPIIPQSNFLGLNCTTDSQCAGLTCLTEGDLGAGTAGPLGGLCSYPCTPNQDICGKVKPGGACRELLPGEFYCVEGCTPGASAPPNCQGRTDLVCSKVLDQGSQSQVDACVPQCKNDALCQGVSADAGSLDGGASSYCHQLDGLCKTTQPPQPSIGVGCGSDAGTACSDSSCVSYPDLEGGTFASACTALCPLNDVDACGTPALGSACIWPEDPSNMSTGAAGQCMSLCGCSGIMAGCDPGLVCVDFPSYMDPTFVGALQQAGYQGYCGPPFGPNGEAVSWSPGGC